MSDRKNRKATKPVNKKKRHAKKEKFQVPTPEGDDFVKSMQELLGGIDFSSFEKRVDDLGQQVRQEEQRRSALRQKLEAYEHAQYPRNLQLHHQWKVTVAHSAPPGGSSFTELIIQTQSSIDDLNIISALTEANRTLRSERYQVLAPNAKILKIDYKGFVDNTAPPLSPVPTSPAPVVGAVDPSAPVKEGCAVPGGCIFCRLTKNA
jgi:hypothetical protein